MLCTNNKIIFLDFDGVLNTDPYDGITEDLATRAINILNRHA